MLRHTATGQHRHRQATFHRGDLPDGSDAGSSVAIVLLCMGPLFTAAINRLCFGERLDGDTVVVYDDWQGFGSARAWWMLTDAGVDARVLDGGLAAWIDAGLPVETGDVTPEPGGVTLQPGQLTRLTIDEAAALAELEPAAERGDLEIVYCSLVEAATLRSCPPDFTGPALLLVSATVGGTHLIDNLPLEF